MIVSRGEERGAEEIKRGASEGGGGGQPGELSWIMVRYVVGVGGWAGRHAAHP